jgi:NAD(P)-dependent dehydrogenase (short-subunit alcohol dehydrogenase family)
MPEKVAILFRAGSETGGALADALARAGYALALVDPDPAVAAALAARLAGARTLALAAPPAGSDVEALVADIAHDLGEPSLLVTCPPDPLVTESTHLGEASLQDSMNEILIRPFAWCRAAGRRMLAQGEGGIVNVVRLSGLGGWPGWLGDSAAMAAMINLTHTLAAEWTAGGVRTSALVGGITPAGAAAIERGAALAGQQAVIDRIPLGRLAAVEDLVAGLNYLIDAGSSYVSGEVLRIDGGWDAWGRLHAGGTPK